MRRLALASLLANIGIVATGGLVRLTNSGLGCPTWPDCAAGDLVPTKAVSWHGAIEFGNRLLTAVVLTAVVAVFVAAMRMRPARPDVRRWAWVTLLGVPAQAVMGGIVTLTKLSPWAVAPHFLLSMALIAAATVLWWRTRTTDAAEPVQPLAAPGRLAGPQSASQAGGVPALLQRLALGVWVLTYTVFCVGTVVTGSGPHAGDASAHRFHVRPAAISQLHADLVMLLVGAAVALAVAVTAVGAPPAVRWTTRVLVGALGFQAAVGFAQYFDRLPIGLVELHVLGAAVLAAAVTAVVLSMRSSANGR
jgi:heme a synthase